MFTGLRHSALALVTAAALLPASGHAGPAYDQGPDELRWVLQRMIEWLPGEWSAFPHYHFNQTVHMPSAGPHENWHRTITLIDAPHLGGDAIFYAQISMGGRDGPIMARSQNLYKIWIDEERDLIIFNGQSPKDPEKYVDLGQRPDLWPEVEFRDEAGIRCDFIWRRRGDRVFGVLEGKDEETRQEGPGSCSYFSQTAQGLFYADAEWVLGPESLWLYDINTMDGNLFVGRADRTHTRYQRTRPYRCAITDAGGQRSLWGHDGGLSDTLQSKASDAVEVLLLRGEVQDPVDGLRERLQLQLLAAYPGTVLAQAVAAPSDASISVTWEDIAVHCERANTFAPPLRPIGAYAGP